ncbi:homoserine O-acetyltransferase MetX [Leptospira bandrabouensis]|uniref:Homoserine O-acetyltransferase n=1 Tax=Leptospira bandrabouensis TaxID=2484903 RepID=A0A6H3NPS5_9LEPT|nr:homoserine O-acetyltransferase [Leptospira bandrabouensis]TGN07609.1 homoserine O-acetyltransferase [Leptospira bandrabouensis]TGN12647.1 homoserine O-acetyltransferase [Leptospira bandrabouensis]
MPTSEQNEFFRGSVGVVQTQVVRFDSFTLEGGESITPLEIAYETYGTLNEKKDNAILVCHALSGDAHAAGFHEGDKRPGWWDFYIGPGKAFDTNRYFIISSNVIGGCKGSSGPLTTNAKTGKPYQSTFPFVSIGDMVNAQEKLISSFGIHKLFAVAGGSMGGMQALQWSVAYPDRLKNCIVMASSSEHSAQQIAFNEVGRQAILSDPNWNQGLYTQENRPSKGLALARMMGHITYLSDEMMREKFGRKPPKGNIQSTDFAVGSYLIYQGESFVDRFDANSYIYVTKALDHFSLGTGKELTKVLAKVRCRFLVVAYTSDWLYPPYQSEEIVKSLEVNAVPVSFVELNNPAGHDSFLLPSEQQDSILRDFLGSTDEGVFL